MLEFIKPLNISVLSFIVDIGIPLNTIDILVLGNFLELNEVILGIELNYLRGVKKIRKGVIFNNKDNFYNQLTLLISFPIFGIKVQRKIKIFTGGKVHVCGCQHQDEINIMFQILYDIINKFQIRKKVELFPIGPLILDSEDYIYNPLNNKIIGLVKSNSESEQDIYIQGEKVVYTEFSHTVYKDCFWISEKFNIKGIKIIFDLTGHKVGFQKKNQPPEITEKPQQTYEIIEEEFRFDFQDRINEMNLKKIDIILLNSYYQIKIKLNKKKLKELLERDNYHVFYEPLIYHALKLMYYFGPNAKNGKCLCSKTEYCSKTDNNPSSKKVCSCIKTTTMISSNGSVLLYGFKSLEQRDEVFSILNTYIDNNYHQII